MDRYEKGKLVGEGAFASVYEGIDTLLSRKVAIKVFHPHLTHNSKWAEQMLCEARLAASITHPGILGVYDVLTTPEAALVLEWVDGNTLEFYLNQNGQMPALSWLVLASECMEALNAAHVAGILHRDIKPSNILLTKEGHIKLADFGLAVSSQGTEQSLAGFKGTPSFASPEVLRGEAHTTSSDVFSMGTVLYMALCGRPVFAGEHLQALVTSILEKDPTPPNKCCNYLLPSMDGLCMQMLSKDIATRIKIEDALQIISKLKQDWILDKAPTSSASPSKENWIAIWMQHPREALPLEKTALISAIRTQKSLVPPPSAAVLARLHYLESQLGSEPNTFTGKGNSAVKTTTVRPFLKPSLSISIVLLGLLFVLGSLMYRYFPQNTATNTKPITVHTVTPKLDTTWIKKSDTSQANYHQPRPSLSGTTQKSQKKKPTPVLNLEHSDSTGVFVLYSKPPFATVWMNGVQIGQTPLKDKKLACGSYRLMVSKKGFQPYSQTLQILVGDTLRLSTELRSLDP